MNEQLKPLWYQQLKDPPWDSSKIIREQMPKVLDHARDKELKRKRKLYPLWIGVIGLFIILSLGINGQFGRLSSRFGLTTTPDWSIHSAAWKDDKMVFQGFPGGNYTSGQANGCWWNLYLPFEQVKGSKLRIDGVNKETGLKISEVPETVLNSTKFTYGNFTRISSKFDLPVGGLWKFEMYLDNKKLGDVVFDVPEGWKPSGIFHFDKYDLRGMKGELGFLDVGLRAGLPKNKFMWFFWGKTDDETHQLFGKKLLISATQKGSSESISLFNGSIGTPNPTIPDNDKVAKAPTAMSLPYAGIWRLDAIIDDKLFGSVYVKVE